MAWGTANTKRRMAAAGRLGSNFVKNLAKGLMIDRTKKHADNKSRRKISAPSILISTKKEQE